MSDTSKKIKWHPIDPATVRQLTAATAAPGIVFRVDSNAVPQQLHRIQGAVSYFVSSYVQGVVVAPGLTAGGEYAVVRHEGDARAYNFLFATSSNRQVFYAGPHKDFAAHRFATSTAVPVESLFGNPLTKGKP
jgi:hypothetical protein